MQGHFFFVDIVGLSDPEKGTTESQIEKIKALHKCISECEAYMITADDKKYVNLTGDGMVIGFLEGPNLPLDLAIELQQKLNEYNKTKKSVDKIEVRIGIDSAPILFYTDIFNKRNLWGDGIIIAKRTMDLGDAAHILLTDRAAKGLRQFQDYRNLLHEVGEYLVKHEELIKVWSAYNDYLGNRNSPKKKGGQSNTQANSSLVRGNIGVDGDLVTFISSKSFDLSVYEAIAIVLYVLDKPLAPSAIDNILMRSWKKVTNIRQYLGGKLKSYVIKLDEGYVLTGEGKYWVEHIVIPKLSSE